MVTDPLSDLLTRLRNASRAGHFTVRIPASAAKERVLKVLLSEGYIHRYETLKDVDGKSFLKVALRYAQNGKPAIRELRRLSTPGRRAYVRAGDIPRVRGGLGTVVISTSSGVISGREAQRLGVGGEVICSVF